MIENQLEWSSTKNFKRIPMNDSNNGNNIKKTNRKGRIVGYAVLGVPRADYHAAPTVPPWLKNIISPYYSSRQTIPACVLSSPLVMTLLQDPSSPYILQRI